MMRSSRAGHGALVLAKIRALPQDQRGFRRCSVHSGPGDVGVDVCSDRDRVHRIECTGCLRHPAHPNLVEAARVPMGPSRAP